MGNSFRTAMLLQPRISFLFIYLLYGKQLQQLESIVYFLFQ